MSRSSFGKDKHLICMANSRQQGRGNRQPRTFGGNRNTPFICLVTKMLQIQPEKEILVEFIKNEDYNVEDFAHYTEFLHFLGANNRAGVAKLDDGTTLFLVPPFDFLTKVLKVTGPESLYGVVLKFKHQPVPNSSAQSLSPPQHRYVDNRQREKFEPYQRSHGLQSSELLLTYSGPPSNSGLSLTPELIAALASRYNRNISKYKALRQVKALAISNEVPQQPGGSECGYYALRYLMDVMDAINVLTNNLYGGGS